MAIASGNVVGQGQIHDVEHVQTVVVGGGQAGLAIGPFLGTVNRRPRGSESALNVNGAVY